MLVSAKFAQSLRAGRPLFNSRVVEAKHRYPGFDVESFSKFLQTGIDPLVKSVAEHAPELVSKVVVAAYEIALDLVGRELAGTNIRSEYINQLWMNIFPNLNLQISEKPSLVMGALCNAVVNLERLKTARPNQWLQLMEKYGPTSRNTEQLLNLGLLIAWRSGAAHFRTAALAAAKELPEDVVADILEIENRVELDNVLQAFQTNPWYGSSNKTGIEVGSFSGFGGHFKEPPIARVNQDTFLIKSGERFYLLIADKFGSVFLPAGKDEYDFASNELPDLDKNDLPKINKGVFISRSSKFDLKLPESDLNLVCNRHTAAITSPYTFSVLLVPY